MSVNKIVAVNLSIRDLDFYKQLVLYMCGYSEKSDLVYIAFWILHFKSLFNYRKQALTCFCLVWSAVALPFFLGACRYIVFIFNLLFFNQYILMVNNITKRLMEFYMLRWQNKMKIIC